VLSCKTFGGSRVRYAGKRIVSNRLRSAHTLPGQSNYWDVGGIVDGFYTNTNPDQGAIAQPDNPGGRCAFYEDTGAVDVDVSVLWPGNYSTQGNCGPIVCINPDVAAFGLCFYYEQLLFGGVYVVWLLGRQPSDITIHAFGAIGAGEHAEGDPLELKMSVRGDTVYCYANGNYRMACVIPAALQGSTLHGVSIDVNGVPGRPANLPVAVAPHTVVREVGAPWLLESGVWNDSGAWNDSATWA